jgi:hypothetical protein
MKQIILPYLIDTFTQCREDFLIQVADNLTKLLHDGSDEITRQMAKEMRTISDKNLELMETNAGLERVTSTTKTAIRKTNSERAELREVIRRLKLKQADPVQRNKELRQVETVELDGNTYYRLVPDRDV